MNTNSFRALTSAADWSEAVDASASHPVVIFKHSSMCPTSARANGEMETLAEEANVPVYRVVVQEAREISDEIANDLNLKHETPQVMVLSNGEAVFDTSHFRVKADAVRDALENAPA
ncbi:bacillithiol system redox-active protein YtxJ [Longibacter salinarum]|uniref:Bacillithiol system redox-active protein YtxJ n=1 Tax=Longibacter salinarum TaxID=1850348 RepID=A0A2A8D361_9BACT|nr:bacillithiol system redox-active protein YtxJ [Longibacter salinarum]PEN15233.1 bacillithiol system redox-active protein YtxJ [Longibacter salinarum]